jgi:predicted nucleotidyltransferase component of viral defense system
LARERYKSQVRLLIQALPEIAKEKAFALKGGTAINLFYRDFPRLSVDIDLTYLPLKPRNEALEEINMTLDRLGDAIPKALSGVTSQRIAGGSGNETRLLIRKDRVEVKIETTPVGRGTVHQPELRKVTEAVEDEYGFAEIPVVAFPDLFGGKLVAALDRQHPRDLYDIRLLYDNEGITDELVRTFLIYVAMSSRPMHEILKPSLKPLEADYTREFQGMTEVDIPLKELEETRLRLIDNLKARLREPEQRFLLTLHDGEPDFNAIGLPQAEDLPAVKWKVLNLRKLRESNPQKHAQQREELKSKFA